MGLIDKRTLLVWLLRALVMLVAIPVHEAAHALVIELALLLISVANG